MKYFDIVNENDEVIGKRTAKECHFDPNLIHRVVHFTLIDTKNRKVLITQRSPEVKFDSGMLCFMGEHVLSDEDYFYTLGKGLKDELGIQEHQAGEHAHHIFTYDQQTEFVRFFLVYWENQEIKINQSEIVDYKWLSLNELRTNKANYSKMTQHWIEAVDWEKVMNEYSYIY